MGLIYNNFHYNINLWWVEEKVLYDCDLCAETLDIILMEEYCEDIYKAKYKIPKQLKNNHNCKEW